MDNSEDDPFDDIYEKLNLVHITGTLLSGMIPRSYIINTQVHEKP